MICTDQLGEGQKAGPKGRQLEVGAQRAPRLLVFYMGFVLWGKGEGSVRNVGVPMSIFGGGTYFYHPSAVSGK